MNAITAIQPSEESVAWSRALRSANAWRGEAVQCFAQTEAAVSETLLALASFKERGAGVRLRHLVGQKFQDLHDALAVGGPFAAEGTHVLSPLAEFRKHEALRPALCHGVCHVSLDRSGCWVILFKLLIFKGHGFDRPTLAFDQRDAEALLVDLQACGQKLATRLNNLRAQLARN